MKELGKIKLNQFSKAELDRRKLNALKGGELCCCSCDCSCRCDCAMDFLSSSLGSANGGSNGNNNSDGGRVVPSYYNY